MAEGKRTDNLRSKYPEIARAFDLYIQCRSQELVVAEITKDKKTYMRIVPHTTGLGVLPAEGGLLDQPYRLMEFFGAFRVADNTFTSKNLS